MKIDDNFYMKLAIDEAWKYQLLTYPNPAVGCVVVKDGKLLAIEAHKEAGMPHAEVNALKTAIYNYGPIVSRIVVSKSFLAYKGGIYNDKTDTKKYILDKSFMLTNHDFNTYKISAPFSTFSCNMISNF